MTLCLFLPHAFALLLPRSLSHRHHTVARSLSLSLSLSLLLKLEHGGFSISASTQSQRSSSSPEFHTLIRFDKGAPVPYWCHLLCLTLILMPPPLSLTLILNFSAPITSSNAHNPDPSLVFVPLGTSRTNSRQGTLRRSDSMWHTNY
ncbi:unnamed protein product [Camellia sinensis]